MKFTLSWLKEHLKTTATLDEICERLTSLGLVVDAVEDKAQELAPFKICHVVEAGKHPNADRLTLCKVDTGSEIIQVICGAPNARTGIKAILARPGAVIPATGDVFKVGNIRGEESQGMMCSAEELKLTGGIEGQIIELPADAPVGEVYATWAKLDDALIEIEVTPNRGDCLGVYGVARDLAASGLGELIPLALPKINTFGASPLKVILDANTSCPVFGGRLIKGVKNGPSPEWLQQRLLSIGLRPISALVDITNYFTFDRGRPLHVFDAAKVRGNLTVTTSKGGEVFAGLDDKEYTLSPDMTIIKDDSQIQAIGGIMGGLHSGCSDETTDVYLEAAFWDPVLTAVTGRKLGLITDARYRFERFVDPHTILSGLEAATQMILDLCGGEASDIDLAGTIPETTRVIPFDATRVQTLGGVEMDTGTAHTYLSKLGLKVQGQNVTTPTWRPDIEGSADLVEEILRLYGYDNIPSTPYQALIETPPLTPVQERRFMARDVLAGRGMTEAVTWSFMSDTKAKLFGWTDENLKLTNPISQEMNCMRPSILPNLMEAALKNHNRGEDHAELFEVGPCYRGTGENDQDLVAAGLRSGTSGDKNWQTAIRPVDVYDAKEDALAVLEACGTKRQNLQITREAPSWYHPGRSGALKQGRNVLAYFGEIHPSLIKQFDLKGPVVGFEVILNALSKPKAKAPKSDLVLSPFMAVERDFAFVVEKSVDANTVVTAALKGAGKLASDAVIFDVFEGPSLGEGKKSLALRLTLQPSDKTLNDEELSQISTAVIQEVARQAGGSLRT